MKKFTKKKVILVSILIVAIIGGSIGGYAGYNKSQQQKQIAACSSYISNTHKTFNGGKRVGKIKELNSIIKKYDEYKDSKNQVQEVSDKYEKEINYMTKYFTDSYEKSIKENSIEDIANCDKKKINTAKENLNNTMELIKREKVCNKSQIEKFEHQIENLVSSYEKQIKIIEKEETKKVAEAKEKARKEEAKRKAATKNSTTKKSSYSKSSSKKSITNQKQSNSSNNTTKSKTTPPRSYGEETVYWYDDGDYMTRNGNVYDKNGNYLGNDYDWMDGN